MLTALIVLLIVLILVAVAALVLVLLYGWTVLRPLARTKGKQVLPGLGGQVEILRDQWGIPHIYATSEADLWQAQGFIHAQDRFWQMELQRRLAQGRLAAIFGAQALEADRLSRTIGFSRAAVQEFEVLDADARAILEAYAAGVNAHLEAIGTRLPAEFSVLRSKPEPWTVVDSLACARVIAWSMSGNWESELLRTLLVERLGPERAAGLEPEYPAGNPTIVPGKEGLQQVAGLLLSQYDLSRHWFGAPGQSGAGSNAWAVDGKHSATGKPILASDPHLPVQMPCFWYENHLETNGGENDRTGLRLAGVSTPGLPGIWMGHNDAIAWGTTNTPADTQDLYIEQPHPTDPAQFRFQDHWEAAQVLVEWIEVREQAEPVSFPVTITRHGPLLNGLLDEAERKRFPSLALHWTGHELHGFLPALLRLNRAQNWSEFQTALQTWTAPTQQFVYADRQGHVGTIMAGLVPMRGEGVGAVPAPGWTGTHEWTGWVPAAELPQVLDPDAGFVVSANHKAAGDEYPHFLSLEWDPGFRARRIADVLKSKPRHTRRDFEVLQNDTLSIPAQQLAAYFSTLNPGNPWERTALRQLVEWNYRTGRESAGAAVYELCYLHLLEKVYGDKLGPALPGYLGQARNPLFSLSNFQGRAPARLLQLLEEDDLYWYAAGGRHRTREELLAEVLRDAVKTLLETVGDNPRRWQWGRFHQATFRHPLGTTRLGWMFSRGPYALDGDNDTVSLAAVPLKLPINFAHVAVAYRQIIDLDDFDRSLSVLNTGQSGQPGSPHYADQIEPWREGEYHPMLWSRTEVEAYLENRLILVPGSV